MSTTLRVRFRTYCYGCRRGRRWDRCVWSAHRWDWEYWLHCGGRRLLQRQGFSTFDRAWQSARRSYMKLASTACLTAASTSESAA